MASIACIAGSILFLIVFDALIGLGGRLMASNPHVVTAQVRALLERRRIPQAKARL